MADQPKLDASSGSSASNAPLREVFYALGLLTLVVVILHQAAAFLAPVALAVLIWFLINAIAAGLRDAPVIGERLSHGVSVALAAVLTLVTIVIVSRLIAENFIALAEELQLDAALFGPTLDDGADPATSADRLGERLEALIEDAARNIVDAASTLFGFANTGDWLGDVDFSIETMVEYIPFSSIAGGLIDFVASFLGGVSMVLLLVLFLLFDQPFYGLKLRALFPQQERREQVERVLAKIAADTRTYVWIMTVVSIGVGVATYLIAAFYGLPGAAFWGFLAFALNYIPTIGTFLGIFFPALFAFGLIGVDGSGIDLTDALTMIGLLFVMQFIVGNLILPRMTGEQLNLSEFVVILSLLVWNALWGVIGMFLAVPLMMVTAIILAQFKSTRAVAILLSKNGRVGRA